MRMRGMGITVTEAMRFGAQGYIVFYSHANYIAIHAKGRDG